MNRENTGAFDALGQSALEKFADPKWTACGARRARVPLEGLETLWFNTGTLCNIECRSCYIHSSPTNDALVYLTAEDVIAYLDEAAQLGLPLREVGFTGGEPFMNPDIIAMIEAALGRGHEALVLTNAMRPMMRPRVQKGLRALAMRFGERLTLRVSLDHHTPARHEAERGAGSFARVLEGMRWLRDAGIRMTVAGRRRCEEDEEAARAGYGRLFAHEGFAVDATNPAELVLFPEMDETRDVPEITEHCWSVLDKDPASVMCASARMVVKRRGAARPVVLACTLLAYDPRFELGETLAEALGEVALVHPFCAQFCVLGGASCSG